MEFLFVHHNILNWIRRSCEQISSRIVNSTEFRSRAVSFPYIRGCVESRLLFCYSPEFFLYSLDNRSLSKWTREPRTQENMLPNTVSMARKQGNIYHGNQAIFDKTMKYFKLLGNKFPSATTVSWQRKRGNVVKRCSCSNVFLGKLVSL